MTCVYVEKYPSKNLIVLTEKVMISDWRKNEYIYFCLTFNFNNKIHAKILKKNSNNPINVVS